MSAYFDQTVQALSNVGGYMKLPALASTVRRLPSASRYLTNPCALD